MTQIFTDLENYRLMAMFTSRKDQSSESSLPLRAVSIIITLTDIGQKSFHIITFTAAIFVALQKAQYVSWKAFQLL